MLSSIILFYGWMCCKWLCSVLVFLSQKASAYDPVYDPAMFQLYVGSVDSFVKAVTAKLASALRSLLEERNQ